MDDSQFHKIRMISADFRSMFTVIPCPFCGKSSYSIEGPGSLSPEKKTHGPERSDMNLRFWVYCCFCQSRGPAALPIFESLVDVDDDIRRIQSAGAVQSWNVRHPLPKPALCLPGAMGCPFCGSDLVDFSSKLGIIRCSDCAAEGPKGCDSRAEYSIEKWNKRAAFLEPFEEIGDGNFRS